MSFKMGWKFYSARTGTSLESFLVGILTMDEALLAFEKSSIEPPAEDLISEIVKANVIYSKKNRPKRRAEKKLAPSPLNRKPVKKKPRRRTK